MNSPQLENEKAPLWKRFHWAVWCVFGVGAGLLIIDHWVHVPGVLPYLILLACPLMHMLMHSQHGHGDQHGNHDQKKP